MHCERATDGLVVAVHEHPPPTLLLLTAPDGSRPPTLAASLYLLSISRKVKRQVTQSLCADQTVTTVAEWFRRYVFRKAVEL